MRARLLQSSMISRVVFDDGSGALTICFRSGLRYIYEGVPRAVYDAIAGGGASAGRFFNEQIKGRYACRLAPGQRKHRPVEE